MINHQIHSNSQEVRLPYVKSPEHLQQCLDAVFDPEREYTQDNIFRAYLWLAYGGMAERTVYDLKTDDISFEHMEAACDDEVSVLYPQGIPSIRNCINLKQFFHKTSSNGIPCNRAPGDRLLRGAFGDYKMDLFRSKISQRIQESHFSGFSLDALSFQNVWTSGVFYRINEGERNGIEPHFISVAMWARHMAGFVLNAEVLQLEYRLWKTIKQPPSVIL